MVAINAADSPARVAVTGLHPPEPARSGPAGGLGASRIHSRFSLWIVPRSASIRRADQGPGPARLQRSSDLPRAGGSSATARQAPHTSMASDAHAERQPATRACRWVAPRTNAASSGRATHPLPMADLQRVQRHQQGPFRALSPAPGKGKHHGEASRRPRCASKSRDDSGAHPTEQRQRCESVGSRWTTPAPTAVRGATERMPPTSGRPAAAGVRRSPRHTNGRCRLVSDLPAGLSAPADRACGSRSPASGWGP